MIESQTTTTKGNITPSNDDGTLIVTVNDVDFCVVMDGCSNRKNSGKFVRLMTNELEQGLLELTPEQLAPTNIRETLEKTLEVARQRVARECIPASLSILILAILEEKQALAFWTGDCVLGVRQKNGEIHWLTVPHTVLSEVVDKVKGNPKRHILTHVIKCHQPARLEGEIAFTTNESQCLLLATDGWWARFEHQDGSLEDDSTLMEVFKK